MAGVIDLLTSSLGSSAVEKISNNLGIEEDKAAIAVSGAIPMLVKALAKNAEDPDEAESIFNAIDKDHDGTALDDVDGFLDSVKEEAGSKILSHVLGGQQSVVEKGLAKMAGLSKGEVSGVLAMLAPLVLGALSKNRADEGLDVMGLAGMLMSESKKAEEKAPDAMGMLGKLLETDGDNEIGDDLLNMGSQLLGGFLK